MNGRRIQFVALTVWSWTVAVFVIVPLIGVIAVSLTSQNFISLPTNGLSLRWYAQLMHRSDFGYAALNSLLLAIEASATSLVLGSLAAVATARYRFPGSETIRLAITSPLFVPVALSGLAMLIFFSQHGVSSSALRLYAAHTAITLPYVFRTVLVSLTGYDMNQEYAARNLGASPLTAFLLVTLPQIAPGIMAGAVFAFIVSFDNVALSVFLTGPQFTTLPVELFAYTMNDSDPMAAAVAVMMILASLVIVLVVERVFGLRSLMS